MRQFIHGLLRSLGLWRSGQRRSHGHMYGRFRPMLEVLESRVALATLTWKGLVSPDWNTAGNWKRDDKLMGAPTKFDTVIIQQAKNTPVIRTKGAEALSVTIDSGATLTVGGVLFFDGKYSPGSLTVGIDLGPFGTPGLVANKGTLNVNADSNLTVVSGFMLSGVVSNESEIKLADKSSVIANIVNQAKGTLSLSAGGNGIRDPKLLALVKIAGDLTNEGTINLFPPLPRGTPVDAQSVGYSKLEVTGNFNQTATGKLIVSVRANLARDAFGDAYRTDQLTIKDDEKGSRGNVALDGELIARVSYDADPNAVVTLDGNNYEPVVFKTNESGTKFKELKTQVLRGLPADKLQANPLKYMKDRVVLTFKDPKKVSTDAPDTTTFIASSALSAAPSTSVMFTATVTSILGLIPSGTVSFFDGDLFMGTGTLGGGVATISTNSLTSGEHNITAAYHDDAGIFDNSKSTNLTQTITGSPPATPTVTSLSSGFGSTGGGVTVTITGDDLTDVNQVLFGDVPAPFVVISDEEIRVTVPAHDAGTVDVTVANSGGVSALLGDDRYTFVAAPAPVLSSIDVDTGTTKGGTVVTLTGSNFMGARAVLFGDYYARSYVVNSGSQITAVAPAQYAGTVDIVVVTPSGTSAVSGADEFDYTNADAPDVTGLSIAAGTTAGGTIVTISGTDFKGTTAVRFGEVEALAFAVLSDTTIVASAPPQAADTVDVRVTTYSGTSSISENDEFTIAAADPPTVSALSTSTGSALGGTAVVLVGTNFLGATSVQFGDSEAAFTVLSDTAIQAWAPRVTDTGTVDVTVTTYGGTSTETEDDEFTYTTPDLPEITGLSVSSGSTAGGTLVVITGSGFATAYEVDFGDRWTFDVEVNSDSQITVLAPAGYAGTVDVRVVTAAGTSAPTDDDRFTFEAADPPAVTDLDVTTGSSAGGTVVLLTGTSFTGTFAVSFGDSAASFRVLSDTTIEAVAPPQAAGTVDVTVTTYTGTSESGVDDEFDYSTAGAPTVTGLATDTGTTAGGTLVGISGTNFTSATSVLFGDVPAGFEVVSATLIVAVAPPQAAGTVDVRVTTGGGTSSISGSDEFDYTNAAAPVVSGLDVATGTTAGGTVVTVVGSGFTGATAVHFGTVSAAFTVHSDTALTAIAPIQAAGTVDVTVTSFSDTSSTSGADEFTYTNLTASAPTVTDLDVTTGSTAGGRVVQLTGTDFFGATDVTFNGNSATAFTVLSNTTIVATAPAGSAATIHVRVVTNNGTSSTSSADEFTYLATAVPVISALTDDSGTTAGGATIVISGDHFTGATAVRFGTTDALDFVVDSDDQITATAPPLPVGTYAVVVTTPSGDAEPAEFTVSAASLPAITDMDVSTGTTAGGTSITLTGTDFTGAIAVYFGGVAADEFSVDSDEQITVVAPAQYAGTLDVRVLTYAGASAATADTRFSYALADVPAVTAIDAATGTTAGGTVVVISGSAFTAATAVYFGGVAADFVIDSDEQITATAPAQAAGVVAVQVVTHAGSSAPSVDDLFTYTPADAPAVTGLDLDTGTTAGGTVVSITGTDFAGTIRVTFGAVAAAFTIDSPTQITAIAPVQDVGTVDVRVTTFAGTSAISGDDEFEYTAADPPTVSGITATSGPATGGTVVTVLGTGFTGATAVAFGATTTTAFQVLSDTALLVTAPGGPVDTVDVTVTSYGGTSATSGADEFTYTSVSAPVVSGLSAASGGTGGGTVLTITGSNFLGAAGVSFGGTPAASFAVVSDDTIVATAPPLSAGTIDVTVSANGLTSARNDDDRYTVTAARAPAVTGLDVATGSTAGGTVVTLTGTAFTGSYAVFFGGVAAPFTVVSDTTIVAVSPAQAAGTVDVVVLTPTGTSAVSEDDEFDYSAADAPVVEAIAADTGSTAGGGSVTVVGSGFTGATAVYFGAVAAAFTVHADGYLTAVVPAQADGTVDVTVVTPGGTSATTEDDEFTYVDAGAPTVTLVTPNGGTAGGTVVAVFGTGFLGATAVLFGADDALSFTVLSDSALLATSPAGEAGDVDVRVVTPSGTSSTSEDDEFTYAAGSAPTVTGLDTASGGTGGGTVVVITGTNFLGTTDVRFGAYSATFVVNSATQITAVAPSQEADTVDVTVVTPYGTSATSGDDEFTYDDASAPAVTSISVTSGPAAGGTWVTIIGTDFLGTTDVSFGSTSAVRFIVVSDTTIYALSPEESAGTVHITVTTPSGTSSTSSADEFTFVDPATLTTVSSPSISATHGVAWGPGVVAQFTDSVSLSGDGLQAIIAWGDGTFSIATFTLNLSGTVCINTVGGHTWASAGSYTVKVFVWGADGSSLSISGSATVADARPFVPEDEGTPSITDEPWQWDRLARLIRDAAEVEDHATKSVRLDVMPDLWTEKSGFWLADILLDLEGAEDNTDRVEDADRGEIPGTGTSSRTVGDDLSISPDSEVLPADVGDAVWQDHGATVLDRNDALFIALSNGAVQDGVHEDVGSGHPTEGNGDALIAFVEDLVTLPVAILDELFACL